MPLPVGRKLYLIQIARAIAIIFVLFGHLNKTFDEKYQYDWFGIGAWERTGGVDFFFIITGFMIYYIYHNQFGIQRRALSFLMKRALKIFPLYWIFTTICLLLSWLSFEWGESYTNEIVIHSFFLIPMDFDMIIPSAWSLSHILMFYLMFAAVIYRPNIFNGVVLLWVLTTVVIELQILPIGESFLFSFGTLEIILGSVVAYVVINYQIKYLKSLLFVGIIGTFGIWLNNYFELATIHAPLFHCIFAIFIILGLAGLDNKTRKIPKSLIFLGNASYSIFITHEVIYKILLIQFEKTKLINTLDYFLAMCFIFILTILIGCFVYSWIEKPLANKMKQILSEWRGSLK